MLHCHQSTPTTRLTTPHAGSTCGPSADTRSGDAQTISELARRRSEVVAAVDQLSAQQDEAYRRFEASKPRVPAEMRVRGALDRLDLRPAWFRPGDDEAGPFEWMTTEGWRQMVAEPDCMSTGEPRADLLERATATLRIAERFDAVREEAEIATGYRAATAAYETTTDELWELDKRILALPAPSIADLLVQATVCRAHSAHPETIDDLPAEMVAALLASIEALAASGGDHA